MAVSTSNTGEESTRKRRRICYTNMYYAQYASETESEPGYDSESSSAARALREDPEHAEFYEMCETEERQKRYHQKWIDAINREMDLKEKVEKSSGMSVRLTEDLVRFKCCLEIEGRKLKYFRVRIAIVYLDYIRRWTFDRVHSQVPDVVTFPVDVDYFQNPLSRRILDIVVRMKEKALEYLRRGHFFEYFHAKVQNDYLDADIQVDKDLTEMVIKLEDTSWPEKLWRTDYTDTLTIKLVFDEDCVVVAATFKIKYKSKDLHVSEKRRNAEILTEILTDAGNSMLEETFEKLMGKKLLGNRYKFYKISHY